MSSRKLKVGDMATITYIDNAHFRRASRENAAKEAPVYLKSTGEVIFVGKQYLTLMSSEVGGTSTPDCDGYDVLLSCIENVKIWKESKRARKS